MRGDAGGGMDGRGADRDPGRPRVGPTRRRRSRRHVRGCRTRHDARERHRCRRDPRDATRGVDASCARRTPRQRARPIRSTAAPTPGCARSAAACAAHHDPVERTAPGGARRRGMARPPRHRRRGIRRLGRASADVAGRDGRRDRGASALRRAGGAEGGAVRGVAGVVGDPGLDAAGHHRRPAVRRRRCGIHRVGRPAGRTRTRRSDRCWRPWPPGVGCPAGDRPLSSERSCGTG